MDVLGRRMAFSPNSPIQNVQIQLESKSGSSKNKKWGISQEAEFTSEFLLEGRGEVHGIIVSEQYLMCLKVGFTDVSM